MRLIQVLVLEGDGKLTAQLRPAAEEKGWLLRQERRPDGCARHLEREGRTLLVLKVGRDLERELRLLADTARDHPDTPIVVVGDLAHPALAGLAWDLGASYVLAPPQDREGLPDIVAGLLGGWPSGQGGGV